ncbi:hypothetical protein GCM10023264_17420 [Sphingomonas daechungensis]|uniref:DUF4167 domain-containing protein n=1 Tax=Sphingomonas daechungensis TaxID=1176646 RepID=UPI0031E8297A
MINNRQGGRRRGRGGGPRGGQNIGGQPGGNRQDNRQRGNAAQLLEKYKSMARDAQLAGDRVQSEYYLQFADHYFRVLSENRARFEEQNPRRQRDDDLDDEDGDEMDVSAEDNSDNEDEQPQRRERSNRGDRGDRGDRPERSERPRRYSRDDRQRDEGDDRNGFERGNGAEERIAMDVLPPAIGREESTDDVEAEVVEARPRRRSTRRPRAQDEGDIAPAA